MLFIHLAIYVSIYISIYFVFVSRLSICPLSTCLSICLCGCVCVQSCFVWTGSTRGLAEMVNILFRGFGSRWKGPQTGSTAQICALVSLPKNTWECDGTYPHFGMSCRKWLYKSWLYVRRLESQGGPAYGYLSTAIVSCCASWSSSSSRQ